MAVNTYLPPDSPHQPAPNWDCCDRAVIEAGFATEEHRQVIRELLTELQKVIFAYSELGAVKHARELLGEADVG